jgi:hypothetical protein
MTGERSPPDVIGCPGWARAGVRLTVEGYRNSGTMEYWNDKPA